MMQQFQWRDFAFFYTARRSDLIPTCSYIADAITYVIMGRTDLNVSLVLKSNMNNDSYETMRMQLLGVKPLARAAAENEMITDEYTYIYMENTREGFGRIPFWVDQSPTPDGKDTLAKQAAEKVLVMDAQAANASAEWFQQAVFDNLHKWPFYCDDCPTSGNASFQASRLADAFYIYANALNKTIDQYGDSAIHNGTLLAQNSAIDFLGYSGRVVIGDSGIRMPIFPVYALNEKREQEQFARIATQDKYAIWEPMYDDESSTLWALRGGQRPLNRPKCGFDGLACPS
ncbi:CBN-GCY-22 protein [Aphelenchoides avenae]|nr:CBN-GCY-22 protein [Aphelenchus avenae]